MGYLVEFSLHNSLHMRFANPARQGDDFSPLSAGVNSVAGLMADSPFDEANYNYLGNPFSSAVSPAFWKLHGFVDNLVVAWLHENGYATIKDECGLDRTCYTWRSQWVGGMTAAHDHGAMSGSPRGGGGPPSAGGAGPGAPIGSALGKLESAAPFRNLAFEQFLNSPRGGGGPPTGGAGGRTAGSELDDPAVFVKRFGPCTNMPEFLPLKLTALCKYNRRRVDTLLLSLALVYRLKRTVHLWLCARW